MNEEITLLVQEEQDKNNKIKDEKNNLLRESLLTKSPEEREQKIKILSQLEDNEKNEMKEKLDLIRKYKEQELKLENEKILQDIKNEEKEILG